jgi:predicted alpha/beta hydrolase family esterase
MTKKQVLFIQGGGKGTHDEWDNKLVASLERELGSADYELHYPRMPDEDNPSYASWKEKIATELSRLNANAILVGHSIGATILLHTLAASDRDPRSIAGIFLIATPFVGEGGWPSDEIEASSLDRAARLANDVPIFFYHGRKDETAPPNHLALYAKAIPKAKTQLLADRDHQLNNDLSEVATDIKRLR